MRRSILRAVRLVERAAHLYHRAVGNLFPRLWSREGACHGCGRCCETPNLRAGRLALRFRPLLRLFIAWHRVVNRFEFRGVHADLGQVEFVCGHYDPVTHRCREYDLRPNFCREFPAIETWLARPHFIAGCGFRAVRASETRTLSTIRDLVADGTLDAAALEKLTRTLAERASAERVGDFDPEATAPFDVEGEPSDKEDRNEFRG